MDTLLCVMYVQEVWDLTIDGEKIDGAKIDDREYCDQITKKYNSQYYAFYYGKKGNEDIAVIFPYSRYDKILISQWIFDVSFDDMVKAINSEDRGEVFPTNENINFELLNSAYKDDMLRRVPELENITLDVPLMLLYRGDYAIVQSESELLVFDVRNSVVPY